jgi:hypothetical protein
MSNISNLKIDPTKADEIISILIQLMSSAEDFKHFNGEQKKKYVLETLNNILFIEPNIKEFIEILIDTLILLDKNKIKIKKTLTNCCIIC